MTQTIIQVLIEIIPASRYLINSNGRIREVVGQTPTLHTLDYAKHWQPAKIGVSSLAMPKPLLEFFRSFSRNHLEFRGSN